MGLEDFKKTVLRNMLVKIASVIAIFAFVKTRQDTGIYILILAGSQVLGNLTLWPYLRHSVERPNWRQLNLFRHLRPSLALFVPQIATTVYLALNKTMLWQMDSLTAAGFYDYSDKLIKLVLALVTATGTVMLPHIANLFMKQQLERVKQYLYMSFDFVLAIAIPMALGVAAVATTLAPLFFGRAFGAVDRLLMIEAPVIILIGMSNVLGQQFLLPTKQTKTYTISVTIGALQHRLQHPTYLVLGRGRCHVRHFDFGSLCHWLPTIHHSTCLACAISIYWNLEIHTCWWINVYICISPKRHHDSFLLKPLFTNWCRCLIVSWTDITITTACITQRYQITQQSSLTSYVVSIHQLQRPNKVK